MLGRTSFWSMAWIGGLLAAPAFAADPAQLEFFEARVRPILANRCQACHGPEKQKAGLRLDSRAAILQGGDSGPAIEPGKPEESRLIEVVRYDGEPQMPPKGKLADAEIAALTDWVKSGAPWPEATAEVRAPVPASTFTIKAEDRAFWSFRPIADPEPPAVRDESWPRSPVDRFILATLESRGLRPVGPADRRTLIRRVTFDLIGLPPEPEDVEAFVEDESPDAFAKVVDRLLASPQYGERWARHWLDVARYAEDQAHTFEARLYPFGYRYRDWVVRALNEDMPYDRFLTEQIAGDLIDGPGRDDRLAATGFFALGPVYYGRAVLDELDDRIDTLCRGVLGLTVACARCHDHKYDPIGQADYYALAGVFASTGYKEYPAVPPEVVARFDAGQKAIKDKTSEIDAYLKAESARWSEEAARSQTSRYINAAWTLANRRKADPKLGSAELARGEDLLPFVLDRWTKLLERDGKDAPAYLAPWRRLVAGQDKDKDLSTDEAARTKVAEVARAIQDYVAATLTLRDALDRQRAAAEALGKLGEGGPGARPALDGAESALLRDLVAADGVFALPKNEAQKYLAADAKAKLKGLRADLERLKKEAPPKYPIIHALAEGASIKNMKLHLRGNPMTLGAEVPRRSLAILDESEPRPFQDGSGRLELARAIASPENPLTARVIVNRLWQHHFGRGLVATASNFGRLGERPSHPELLDYLARSLIESGWSLKALHRLILLTSTYQLASVDDPANREADAANTLLWRANRRRLEVESWRDAMLAVSGRLDRTLGGPSAPLTDSENRRRTLYAKISRHNLDGLLRLFDFPDPNLTSGGRTVTAVPLQQLFVLNSAFMEGQARALADRLAADHAPSEADRIRRAVSLLFGRPATEDEVRIGLEFLAAPDDPGSKDAPGRWQQYAQALLGTNEFLFID